jgi:ABC-2 type transport system permease protein
MVLFRENPPIYDSDQRPAAPLRELNDLLRYHELLSLLIGESIKVRYKRSVLGVFWTLLNPLLNMVVLSVAFSALFRASLDHYPIYVLAGLLCWNFFTQGTLLAIDTTVSGNGLLKRIYVPRTIFSVAAIGNSLINILLSFIPLLLIMLAIGQPVYPTWWFLPIAVLMLACFTLGIGLLVATLAVFFGDMAYIYQALIQAWFFLTPIMYPVDIIPADQRWLFNFNPFYHLILVFREPIYTGQLPELYHIVIAGIVSVAVLIVGWCVFTQQSDKFAYRI